MKRHVKIALIYAVLAMVFGVFYREFTKAYYFDGITALGRLHTHLFVLGMGVFLLVALFDDRLNLQSSKLYLPFMIIYNCGVGVLVTMLTVRGVFDVIGGEYSDGAISGIAGLGHVVLAVGIVLLFVMLIKQIKSVNTEK